MTARKLTVALFDMDGVIFQGDNFWLELHRAYGTEAQGLILADELMKTDYCLMSRITVEELWKGKSAKPLLELVESREYEAGVHELFDYLHSLSIKIGIVSSGPMQLARRAQAELAINELRANYVHIEDGIIAGTVEVSVPDNEKDRIGLSLIKEFLGDPASTLFIGNEHSDAKLASKVGLSIAYNCSDESLINVSKYVLPKGRLCEVIRIIKDWQNN